jgi:4-diphosphocytidyl-2-C-methyl-D-erythritol kinase
MPGRRSHLEKHLPHAGGIGGGSADAGAALRGLAELWDVAPPGRRLLAIGADTPVCALAAPARMRGIGDILDPVPPIPPLWLVLANPGVEVPTGPVFKALASVENAPLPSRNGPMPNGLLRWLAKTRNDLEPAARAIVPAKSAMSSPRCAIGGCRLARMSGSGATCFGLFTTRRVARDGAEAARRPPDWWVEAAPVLTQRAVWRRSGQARHHVIGKVRHHVGQVMRRHIGQRGAGIRRVAVRLFAGLLQRSATPQDLHRVVEIAVALVALLDRPDPERAFRRIGRATARITGSVSFRSRKSSPVFLPIWPDVPPQSSRSSAIWNAMPSPSPYRARA